MRELSLKLSSNSDVIDSLQEFSFKQNSTGYILSVVGDLSTVVIQCPGKSEPSKINGHLEVITLSGIVKPNHSHLHLSFSDGDCKVWGGHLNRGTIVFKALDILVGFIDNPGENNIQQSTAQTKSTNRLKVYTLNGCPWSKRAIRLLKTLDIEYDLIIIGNDEQFENLRSISNSNTFPQIFLDDKFLGGYESILSIKDYY